MKPRILIISIFAVCATSTGICMGQSLLSSQSFPKTFNDLAFTQRVAVLADGYDAWESEYDANGRCISGCAYSGVTIQEDLQRGAEYTNAALQNLQASGYLTPTGAVPTVVMPPVVNTSASPTEPETTVVAPIHNQVVNNNAYVQPRCTPNNPSISENQSVPLGEPLIGTPKITSKYGSRIHPVTKRQSMHKGIDFSAPVGTDVFAPANGTVAAVFTDSTCGKGIRISHSGEMETTYCHLSKQLVATGDTVSAGCRIGQSGNTGRSTGPHLHYGVKYRGEYIDPEKFIARD